MNIHPEQLLQLARQGEDQALGRLLELYRSYLTLCSRLQIDRQFQGKFSASDVVQDTFVQATRAFPQFRGSSEQELLHWLRQILASRLAKLVRRYRHTHRRDINLERQLELDIADSAATAYSLAASEPSPSQEAMRRECAVLLSDALDCLPYDYREIIILHHFHGLTFAAIGLQLTRSEEGVKKTWARALAALRRAYDQRARDG